MKKIFVALLVCSVSVAFAQEDSLRLQVLEAIVVEGVSTGDDTLQHFYSASISTTTENILSRMKSVTLIRRGAYGQEPLIRALGGGQLNITLDGMQLFSACTDKMDPVTIYAEPQNLKSIQVLPGTQGLAFGSTIGGTLNMKLAEPIINHSGVSGRSGVDFQSAAYAFNYFTVVNIARSKSGYHTSLTYRNSNDYRAGGGQRIPYSQYRKLNASLAGKWALAKYDTLLADVLFDRGWNIGFPALPMDVATATAGIFSVTYRRIAPWLFFNKLSGKVYYNTITHRMDDSDREDVSIHMDMPGRSNTAGMFVDGDIHLFHQHRTSVKVEYFVNSLIGEMTMYPEAGANMYMQTAPEAYRQRTGLFVDQQFMIEGRHKLGVSMRADWVSDYLLQGIGRQQWEVFNPMLDSRTAHFLKTFSVIYKHRLNSNLMFEFQAGYGERMPTLNERYGFYLFNRFDGYDYLGNPQLRNENTWSAEATMSYFNKKIELQITPFFQHISNYIMGGRVSGLSPMTTGANGVKQYKNFAWSRISGFDVTVLSLPLAKLQSITTIKYNYGVYAQGGAMPLMPPLKLLTSLRYEMKAFDLQATCEWSAPQNRVSTAFGEQKTPSYIIMSVQGGWRINSSWKVSGGVENLTDRRYREHLDWGGIPRPGRNIFLNVVMNY